MCNCGKENSKYFEPFETVLSEFKGEEPDLIPILQRLQDAYGYLPEDIIRRLSERTGIFISRILGVATFYSQFKLKPSGKHTIKVCFGTPVNIGAETIAEALCDELGIALVKRRKTGNLLWSPLPVWAVCWPLS